MRVVINQAQIERNRKISHILFFVSLAGMGAGFFLTWTRPTESTNISCLILPILLFMTLTSVRMANTWIREPRPTDALSAALKGLGQKYAIFHYLLPAPHVLIGPEGVFAIATVWQDRPYRVKQSKWYGDQGLVRKLNGYMRQDLLGNPFRDAQFYAQQVQKIVDKVAPDSGVEVEPLVVFINPKASVEIEDPIMPVLYADPKKKPSLRQYLREVKKDNRPALSLEAQDRLDELYGLVSRHELEGFEPVDEEDDVEEIPEGAAGEPDEDQEIGEEPGTVYIARVGQLYYIGVTRDPVAESLESLKDSSPDIPELVHSFQSDNPEAMEAYLHRKFERKRQKEIWFGLSKKDVAWLQTLEGELK
jgi:hypothetical protein